MKMLRMVSSSSNHPALIHVPALVPVLDLQAGRVVRAQRGERSAYRPIVSGLAPGSSDPLVLAPALLAAAGGTSQMYLADLDAIQRGAPQLPSIAALLAALPQLTLWLDAGFADAAEARALRCALGAAGARVRPVYGSESLANVAALAALTDDSDALLSLDSRAAQPLDPAGCWQRPALWPRSVIVMTLDRVGTGLGPDLATFGRLRRAAPGREWIGAGGLRGAADLAAAAAAGASAWLVASALHDGTLSAKQNVVPPLRHG
jgi:phosphoribosylformimino-5-aminoimidazole carboxamide ribotide isomerase